MNIYIRELSRELGRRGWHIDVFTRWHREASTKTQPLGKNARVIHIEAGPDGDLPKEEVPYYVPEFLENVRRFRQESQLRYDLVHSHYWISGLVAGTLGEEWHVPHVAMFHTLGEMKNRSRLGERETEQRLTAERQIMANADCLVASTEHEKEQMVRLYGAPASRIEVIPCGVDLKLFHFMDKGEARKTLGLPEGKIVLFVGRIEPLKGIDILLEAVAQLEDRQDIRAIIVGGDGESSQEVQRLRWLAEELGLADKVSFWGSVEHERLPLVYNAADVCVMPSYYESFGLVALEAMACGTPVVASRVGGLKSTVKDGETGYLIPWHCPEPFAERLEILLSNDVHGG
jgi:D-inositol-3-phosphate glycosyltransferase